MRVGNWASAPHHRSQLTLFSPSLDDMIPPGHQIRGLEQLVQLFDWSDWEAGYDGHRGQPPIHPSLIAGAILYGLKEGIRSSRKLEDATKMRIDFMWFLNGRVIDHSTFAAFRTRFGSELRDLFKQLAVLAINRAVEIELAVDGTRIRASSSRTGALTADGIERRAAQVAKQLTEALERMEQADLFEGDDGESPEQLEKRIHRLEREQEELARALEKARERDEAKARKADKRMAATARVPVTDPDAHVLTNKEGGYAPNYTPTVAVDTATGTIVDAQVPTGSDEAGVVDDVVAAAEKLGKGKLSGVLFDSAFATGSNLEKLSSDCVPVYAPTGVADASNPAVRPDPSTAVAPEKWDALPMQGKKRRVLARQAFIYDPQDDCYRCPMGRALEWKRSTKRDGVQVAKYLCGDCSNCPLASKCLSKKAKKRSIWRDQFEPFREELKERMNTDGARQIYRRRAPAAEGVIGHIKHVMGIRHFLLRGQEKVRTEWLWACSAHNLSKILNSGWDAVEKQLSALKTRLRPCTAVLSRPRPYIMITSSRCLAA